MASIGDLVASLSVDNSNFKKGLAGANRDLGTFVQSATSQAASLIGILGVAWGGRASLDAAQEDLQAMQRLGAVLNATGGAAGFSAQEIGKFASELQRTTNFGDEVTVQAAAIAATFKNIRGDQFKQLLKTAQDFSELKGVGLSDAVTMLGKALNDPIEGFAKLNRAGIQFTETEKDKIALLQQSGDVASAQQVMLESMQKSFGGVAEAAANPIKQLQNYLGDVGEEIGKILLVGIRPLKEAVIPFLENWGSKLAKVAVAFGVAAGAMRVIPAIQKSIAVGQALIQSLSGPAGIASMIAGAAAFTAALVGINAAMGDATASAAEMPAAMGGAIAGMGEMSKLEEDWNKQVKQSRDFVKDLGRAPELKALEGEIQKIKNAFGTLTMEVYGTEGAMEKIANLNLRKQAAIDDATDRMSGFTSATQKAAEEWHLLNGYATETTIMLGKMSNMGVPDAKLRQLKTSLEENESLKELKKQGDKNKSDAASIIESIKTPQQKLDDQLGRLEELHTAGHLDDQQFALAKQKAEDDAVDKTKESNPKSAVSASLKGTQEAASIVLRRTSDPATKIAQDQLNVQKETLAAVKANKGMQLQPANV